MAIDGSTPIRRHARVCVSPLESAERAERAYKLGIGVAALIAQLQRIHEWRSRPQSRRTDLDRLIQDAAQVADDIRAGIASVMRDNAELASRLGDQTPDAANTGARTEDDGSGRA